MNDVRETSSQSVYVGEVPGGDRDHCDARAEGSVEFIDKNVSFDHYQGMATVDGEELAFDQ